MHVTQEEQDKRFLKRLADPWKRWKTGKEDYRNREKRDAYLEAYQDMFTRCDTRWAPWTIIDANNKKAARIAFLKTVADQLEKHANMTPPALDPVVEALAHQAFPDLEEIKEA
jgi:polyphosphate kinase 2 (PPK2 family)